MKKLIGIMALTTSLFVHAGDRVGNGGDVIVCPNSRTVVLDIFQGSVDWGFEPIMREGSRTQIISETLKSFSAVDPVIASKLLDRALEMEKEIMSLEKSPLRRSKLVKFTTNNLINIADEGIAELPPGCEIVQAATQNQKPFPGEVKFTFQKNIWMSLDTDVQTSLILHEVVYEHMIAMGELSSRSTRYFNSALHANYLQNVKNYFEVSMLFSNKNLQILVDGKYRTFGEKGLCKIKMNIPSHDESSREGVTIMVGRQNIITLEPNFNGAMKLFWEKYASQGACD
ncbi:hypothetical protein [Peredibacter starrii]|uniref:LPP20 lipoprotein n=1 Tax=Peredibacter starrii TaxID=28202 RepID=A0AAX4HLH9_9BACT|nr:hypothetical protein [Peredibacter starrii]WPU64177.1 hypothetical protein SOO65_15895 [Peredibacter starrii]